MATPVFSVIGWAPFVSLSNISLNNLYEDAGTINAGYAVNLWRPHHFSTVTDAVTHQPVGNIFTGIDVDLALQDTDAWISRLAFNITLLGRIVFSETYLG